jgi:hypothetical protein
MTLEERIAAITRMSATERKTEWRRLYGTPAPPGLGLSLMTRALAYRLQERKLGGLNNAELRRLAQLSRKEKRDKARNTTTTLVKPGTWLSRTWHGDPHQVIVLESGFEYRGQRYASLSAIAQLITGAKWSGPRFFGLHSTRLGKLGVTADV